MDNIERESIRTCLPVSLWQAGNFLGWYRAKDICKEGLLVTGPVNKLINNRVVTVSVELTEDHVLTTYQFKALVLQRKDNGTELLWIKRYDNLRELSSFMVERRTA